LPTISSRRGAIGIRNASVAAESAATLRSASEKKGGGDSGRSAFCTMPGTASSPLLGRRTVPPTPTSLFMDDETERVRKRSSGNDLVVMLTAPPVKLPGRSGVKVLAVTTLSIRLDGKTSRATLLPSGSALGRSLPLSCVSTYRP
jgi:hypothetical protein